jgi:hypothetical protein
VVSDFMYSGSVSVALDSSWRLWPLKCKIIHDQDCTAGAAESSACDLGILVRVCKKRKLVYCQAE